MVVATSLLGFITKAFSAFTRIRRPRFVWTSVLMACFVVLTCAYVNPSPANATAGINQQINFQGRLLNAAGATVPDGFYNIQFKIYQDGDGLTVGNTTGSPAGTLKWTEEHLNNNSQGVTIKNGFMSVQLGSVTAFGSSIDWNQDTIWLSMNIGSTNATCTPFASCSPDGEMVPMKRMSATPYSLNSGLLNGLASSNFVQLAQGVQTDAAAGPSSIFINKTAAGNLLQLQSSGDDAFTVSNAGNLTFGAAANHTLGVATAAASTAGKQLTVSAGGGGSGTGSVGGDLVLQGGAAGGTNANGGNVTLNAGAKTGSGTDGTIAIGTSNTSGITLGQSTTLAADKSLTITGSGTRPSSPTEGMIYYDTTTKQLLVYANGKWQADRATSTKIVGTSASGGASSAIASVNYDGADYVNASTTSAQTVINSALSSLPASGGSVYLMEGTYVIDGSILIPDNVTLTGAGAGTIIKLKNSINADINAIINSNTTTGHDVTVSNIALDGNSANNSAGNQYGVVTSGMGSVASARQGVRILNIAATGFRNYSFSLFNSQNSTLSGSSSTNASGGGSVYVFGTSASNIITGNTFVAGAYGIVMSGAGTVISNNNIQFPTTSGIYVTSSLNTITGNYIAGSGGTTLNNAIYLTGADSNTITGNTIYDANCSTTCYAVNIFDSTSDTNYLASNSINSGTLNNAGTGTIFGGQVNSAGNFAIQPASTKSIELLANTNITGDLSFTASANRTISVVTAAASTAGKQLTVSAGGGGSGTGSVGGDLVLQGGAAGGTNANGGNIYLSGGAGTGTGTQGLVSISASAHTSVTNATCAANCTITQANVDNYGAVIINASTSGIVITLPPPTNTTTLGRIVYITTAAGSQDFTLTTNSGASTIDVAMRKNTTATMIWNGSAWTPGGASNATTLQATYANGTNPSATPEIKLDSTRGTIDIQDADTTIGSDLLDIRGSNGAGLGTVLFGVSNTGRVTIQNTADLSSSFRVLNASGDYVLNINNSNNYIINNSITSPGNAVANPSFESGGAITSGEEGWFGPAQASIVNDSSNAQAGNYELQVTPNATNLDVYASSYYEVKPDDQIYFEGWIKNSAGANGTAGIQITWYDKDKANPTYSTDYATLPGTSYILKKVNGTVPSGKYFARVSATVRSGASTGTFYFDNFYMKKSSEAAPYAFRNSTDSTAAFVIQSAGSAQTLFTADTTNNLLKVGDSTGSDTATTLLVVDSTTADPTTSLASKNGGLYYRSDTNNLKVVIGGATYDICTTAVTCTGYSASASSSIQLQGSSPGTAQVGHFNITGTGILGQLQTQDQSAASTNSSNLVIRTGNATGTTSNSGNLTIDVGTATGTTGSITIGHSGVATTMAGTLDIQGASGLKLGTSTTTDGSILFRNSVGSNTVTLVAASANPTSSWTLILPQNPGSSGDCLKDSSGSGALTFGNCTAGMTTTLQDAYSNSSAPATITLADNKNFVINGQDTATDSNMVFNLQCTTCSANGGRFAVQNGGTDVFVVKPNGGGIVLNAATQIGSATTDATQVNLQLDSYNGSSDSGTCTTSSNVGAIYYNTTMGSIRGCINGSWSDISNPDTFGLLGFGVIPSSGSNPYDLPALVTAGASGPCKVSWANATSITWQACTVYSGGKRVSVTAPGSPVAIANTTSQWQHLCLTGSGSQPALSTANADPKVNMPTFSISAPILCLADIKSHASTSGNIGSIYDTRTFTSTVKEAVNISTTGAELGMLVDSGTSGLAPSASCTTGTCSGKLYGVIVATDGSTSAAAPNAIITTAGPGYVKATSGTSGDFLKSGATSGYAASVATIPNNAFYYSPGNARTSYSTTCTAASNCNASIYVNFIVR